MGYNTVAVIYNDFTHEIRRSGRVGEQMAQAMMRYHDINRDSFARHFHVGMVVSQDHSSGEQVVLVTKNAGWRVEDAPEIGWHAVEQMKRCLERHGYKVTKSRKKRAPGIEAAKAAETTVSAEGESPIRDSGGVHDL